MNVDEQRLLEANDRLRYLLEMFLRAWEAGTVPPRDIIEEAERQVGK